MGQLESSYQFSCLRSRYLESRFLNPSKFLQVTVKRLMILDDSEEKMEGGRGSSKKENKTLTDRQLTIDVLYVKNNAS